MADVKFSDFTEVTVMNGTEKLVGLSGVDNASFDVDVVKEYIRPYIEFEARVSQAGTNAPTVSVTFLNEFGPITMARVSTGVYSLTGVFPGQVPTVNSNVYSYSAGTWRLGKNSDTVLLLETSSGQLRNSDAYSDGQLLNEVIKFRMYL